MEHCGEFLGKCEVKKGIPFVFVFCTPFFFFFFMLLLISSSFCLLCCSAYFGELSSLFLYSAPPAVLGENSESATEECNAESSV